MKRKMSEEITRDEMLRLREQGYSNTEIAEQLECCYATVLKYIGKGGIRRRNAQPKKPELHNFPIGEDRLSIVSRTFQGGYARFIIHNNEIGIDFPDRDCYVLLSMREYEEFAKDIIAASQVVR